MSQGKSAVSSNEDFFSRFRKVTRSFSRQRNSFVVLRIISRQSSIKSSHSLRLG